MNKLFTPFNFFICLAILILGSIAHLIYGNCQDSKIHFIVQYYYMPDHLPNWMVKYDRRLNGRIEVDKNYSGKWLSWYRSGAKLLEANFKEGKLNGKSICWYESGAIKSEDECKDDKRHGISIEWYENGVKKNEYEFKDGELNGKATQWHLSGKKLRESECKNGQRYGKFTEWDANGKKIKEQEWKDGEMIKDYLEPTK